MSNKQIGQIQTDFEKWLYLKQFIQKFIENWKIDNSNFLALESSLVTRYFLILEKWITF